MRLITNDVSQRKAATVQIDEKDYVIESVESLDADEEDEDEESADDDMGYAQDGEEVSMEDDVQEEIIEEIVNEPEESTSFKKNKLQKVVLFNHF